MTKKSKIVYTITDEAPALATRSLLPIVKAFTSSSHINFETKDISLAARILANFSDVLPENQRIEDALTQLGELAKKPEANIIKLPNISASVPQLIAAIKELQSLGYKLPDYPETVETTDQKVILERYNKVKGSAVNPVLREGNSDRRAPKAVKNYAKKNPHSMGVWSSKSQSHVATMSEGDFANNEKSTTIEGATYVRIVHTDANGQVSILKDNIALEDKEIIDTTFMSKNTLLRFLEEQIEDAKQNDLLFSLHMKATMMKVSDPIIFGHAVRAFFKDLFDKHGKALDSVGVDVNNGFGNLLSDINQLPPYKKEEILSDIETAFENNPDLAMVDSDRGISNLHVPSDVIIDASMPAMIRTSGQMWNKDGKLQDTKAVIPDSSYAGVYQTTIDFCKKHGAFDPRTMGTVPNIGLMAKKAEEYGSHNKTFEVHADGIIQVIDSKNTVLLEHNVGAGDIWRMCQVKDAPIQDWVKLAVNRARATEIPAVFWLGEKRSHDFELIKKVNTYLQEHNTEGLDIRILSPEDATLFSLERIKEGKDTISVTGNVLRDYLTDLFPILELGTSAKMLSIVPLMNGGGLFETGAGGSAPKHVQQFSKENHLRWDSLGEFLALSVSLEHYGTTNNNSKAIVLSETLDDATDMFLDHKKSPSRKVGELDNRGSHFYLALFWAKALASQDKDNELKNEFSKISEELSTNEQKIINELNSIQGESINIGGYYLPNSILADKAMQPSNTLTKILGNM